MLNDWKYSVDASAVTVVVATLAGYLPAMATMLTIVWMVIRIYETDTVRGWVKREQRQHERKLFADTMRQETAKADVIEAAKEAVKPQVVEEVIAALPLKTDVAEALKEKVLSNDNSGSITQTQTQVASTKGR